MWFRSDGVTDAERRSKPIWPRLGLLISLAGLLAYLLLPTKNYYWDGVGFALTIEDPHASLATLIHPNHLLYSVMGYAAWKLAATAITGVRALFVLQAINGLFAAATNFLVWKTLVRLTRSPVRAGICTLIFSFSATWWKFSSDANAYIPSVFFLMVCLGILTTNPRPVAAGLAHSLAMVFHQLAIFFVPVAVVAFLYDPEKKDGDKPRRFKRMLQYALTAALPTVLIYTFGFKFAAAGTSLSFWDWITTRSQDSAFSFNLLSGAELTLRGTMRLFFGGRFGYLRPDTLTYIVAVLLALVLAVFLLYRGQSSRPDTGAEPAISWARRNCLPLAWIISFMAFLWIWLPQNTFYRLFYLPALLLLAVNVPWKTWVTRVMAFACVIMIACNFVFYIYPHTKTNNNEVLAFALDPGAGWRKESVIMYREFHPDLWTIGYFNPRISWIQISSPTIAQIETVSAEAGKQGSVWLETNVYNGLDGLPGGREWLRLHVDYQQSQQLITPKHNICFYRCIR